MADIEKMTLPELREHRKSVDALISQREVEDRQKAIEAAKEAARQFGFEIGDLFGGSRPQGSTASTGGDKKPRKPVEPKYAHPTDPTKVWSGRGPNPPAWMQELIALGQEKKDFLIK
ncbi:H-NS histone family protein [Pseudotabrizicola formosa]|uniref:H-NS histone family protein n=1 Tax=Pseudotabrizicola formosa TaxID=2030009 RepID=UPI00143D9E0D|nr:H-NS histone family protein [Pseudotabrizicola formosa]